MKPNQNPNLSERLGSLEQQISRLADLLAEQAVIKKRRRKLTIRVMLGMAVVFAMGFAWMGRLYQNSRFQARAVDRLIEQSAFVKFDPRESTLVSLLPGSVEQPPTALVNLLGDDFFREVTNVSTGPVPVLPRDKDEVLTALHSLPQLRLLRLTNLQLKTSDLQVLADLPELQSLDVGRTGLDTGSMPWLRDAKLRWLRAAHTQFSDNALQNLAHCRDLQFLDLERTIVSDNGVMHLTSLPTLRYLNLKRCPVSRSTILKLAKEMPGCQIEWEPLVMRSSGKVDAQAARQGALTIGTPLPVDPRESRRAIAPIDAETNYVWPTGPFAVRSY
jgi:hypothetical protein